MNQVVQPKKPPTMLQLKREEMLSHLDSHTHLAKLHEAGCARPVILEAPIRSPTISGPHIIDNNMTSVAAAILDGRAILITDMSVMNGVDAADVNIVYLVHPGEIQPEGGSENGQYPKIFIHVNTVQEALDSIKAEMKLVSELADIKKPLDLDARHWSFMAVREVRVIGKFALLAEAMEFAHLLQVGWPNITPAGLFKHSTVGKNSFTKNNYARAFLAYREHGAEIEAGKGPDFQDPYWNWAWHNVKATASNYRLDVKFTQHTKNKHGKHPVVPTGATDLVILTRAHYTELMECDGVGSAMVVIIDDKAPMTLGTNVSFFSDFHNAVEYVMVAMQTTAEHLVKHVVIARLQQMKHIHVFIDVVGEAY